MNKQLKLLRPTRDAAGKVHLQSERLELVKETMDVLDRRIIYVKGETNDTFIVFPDEVVDSNE